MWTIKDKGKVWLPGNSEPVFALRIGEKVFVPGMEEGVDIDYWIHKDVLCLDLHDPIKKIRTARKIPLNLFPKTKAILFGGFEKTKHGEVLVVTFKDQGVQDFIVERTQYIFCNIQTMHRNDFWKMARLI